MCVDSGRRRAPRPPAVCGLGRCRRRPPGAESRVRVGCAALSALALYPSFFVLLWLEAALLPQLISFSLSGVYVERIKVV